MSEIKICCKGTGIPGSKCIYDSPWFCQNPDCKGKLLTATLMNARPQGCPLKDKWRYKL